MKVLLGVCIVTVLVVAGVSIQSCASTPNPGVALGTEYYNLGNAWFDLKRYDEAARAYQNALGWNPNLKIAVLNLARTKAELGDPGAALDVLAPLATSDPDNLAVAQYRAWLTAKLKGPAAAADLYAALVVKLPGDAAMQFNAGLSLAAAHRPDEALGALKAWKALDGKNPVGLAALAQLVEEKSPVDGAQAWLEAAQAFPENDQRRFKPLFARAQALETAQLYGDAVTAWNAVLALPVAPPAVTPAAAPQTPGAPGSTPPGSGGSGPPTSGTPPGGAPGAAPTPTPQTTQASQTTQATPGTPSHTRAEAQFLRGRVLLLRIEDYDLGSQGLIDAWKAGYRDPEAWKKVLTSPLLKESVRLQADLKLAGVTL